MKLAGRVAIVTGGSGGIGRAIVLGLAAEKAAVVVSNRGSREDAESVVDEVCACGGTAAYVSADVTRPAAVEKMVSEVIERFGRVDILVNNAGISRDSLLPLMRTAQWQEVIDVNLSGVFYCTRAVVRPMALRRSGAIINISSILGERPWRAHVNYSAAKAAVNALTRASAVELARFGIRVNAVAPGFILTKMTRTALEKFRDRVLASIPLGDFGQPEDVAKAVAFLASDDARYITGEVLHVTGGAGIAVGPL
ncbi:MAG: 3-oxoacyl-ACP reductase FabG [Candidatus Rokubacteria bacterium]|nr:3-oxoacyl-ACP reductase FabG [Candidatus Rokubacteria bacterium]